MPTNVRPGARVRRRVAVHRTQWLERGHFGAYGTLRPVRPVHEASQSNETSSRRSRIIAV